MRHRVVGYAVTGAFVGLCLCGVCGDVSTVALAQQKPASSPLFRMT